MKVGDQIFNLSFVPVDKMGYINIYGRDVTAEKEADRIKSVFIASVSHELRTPLAPILGWSEILLSEKPGSINDEQREFLQAINDSGTHLHNLVNDLLDVTSIEAGQFRLELDKIDFQNTIQKAIKHILPAAKDKHINIDINIPSNIPEIQADSIRIEQVLMNLLSNAVKFTLDGGEISVNVKYRPKKWLKIAIQDSGIGIDAQEISMLFGQFNRTKNVIDSEIKGTGLGLYISKKIIEGHGGTITVSSIVGIGSTFEIRLPVEN